MAVELAAPRPEVRERTLPFGFLAAVPAWLWLAGIVAASFCGRLVLALGRATPLYFPDEYIYSSIARSLAESGKPLIRGRPGALPRAARAAARGAVLAHRRHDARLPADAGRERARDVARGGADLPALPPARPRRRASRSPPGCSPSPAPDLLLRLVRRRRPDRVPARPDRCLRRRLRARPHPTRGGAARFLALQRARDLRARPVRLPPRSPSSPPRRSSSAAASARCSAKLRLTRLPRARAGRARARGGPVTRARLLLERRAPARRAVDPALGRHRPDAARVLVRLDPRAGSARRPRLRALAAARPGPGRVRRAGRARSPAALLLEAGLYATNGSHRFQERYLITLLPLVVPAFGLYVKRGWPARRGVVLAALGLLVLSSRIPLSGFTVADAEAGLAVPVRCLPARAAHGDRERVARRRATCGGAVARRLGLRDRATRCGGRGRPRRRRGDRLLGRLVPVRPLDGSRRPRRLGAARLPLGRPERPEGRHDLPDPGREPGCRDGAAVLEPLDLAGRPALRRHRPRRLPTPTPSASPGAAASSTPAGRFAGRSCSTTSRSSRSSRAPPRSAAPASTGSSAPTARRGSRS